MTVANEGKPDSNYMAVTLWHFLARKKLFIQLWQPNFHLDSVRAIAMLSEIINVRDDVLVRWFYPVMTRVEQEQYCIVFSDRQAELNYCILVFL